jgi:hypothetical protein
MAEGKYGRLFTESDVRELLVQAACRAMDGPDDTTAAAIAEQVIAHGPSTFPADEPLFVLRGQDAAAPETIARYCVEAEKVGAGDRHRTAAALVGVAMVNWQAAHPERVKVPGS